MSAMSLFTLLAGLVATIICASYSASLFDQNRPWDGALWAVVACVVFVVFGLRFVWHA